MNPEDLPIFLRSFARSFATVTLLRDFLRISGRVVIFIGCGWLVFVRGDSGWLFALALVLAAFVR